MKSTRLIIEAAPLLAAALAGTSYLRTLNFTYGSNTLLAKPNATSLQRTNRAAFAKIDKAFQDAGWECLVKGSAETEIHMYVPWWMPHLVDGKTP